jgi:hypothetical protein
VTETGLFGFEQTTFRSAGVQEDLARISAEDGTLPLDVLRERGLFPERAVATLGSLGGLSWPPTGNAARVTRALRS